MKNSRGWAPSRTIGLACVIIVLALASSTAWSIPTPLRTSTGGPATPTKTGSPTPTGTYPVPDLHADARPNPARAGQRVTLDATANPSSLQFHWQQVPGDVQLEIVDADQPVAHFIAPAVTAITFVQVQLQSQNDGRVAYAPIMLLPPDVVLTSIGHAYGVAGGTVPIDVRLQSVGLDITKFEHQLSFDPYAPVVDRGGGVPDCAPASELSATSAEFAFVPAGCASSGTCTGLRASVTTPAPIPDGAVVYRCQFALTAEETPDEIGCYHAFICTGGGGATSDGDPIRVVCTADSNGFAWANLVHRPLQFEFSTEPAAPSVGDTVHVTFVVSGQGGLPSYQLGGARPYFAGETTQTVGGPLGAATFELQAVCPGTAQLSLGVEYETVGGCPGHTYFQFIYETSAAYPLTISGLPEEPSGACATFTPTPTPNDSIPPTPTTSPTQRLTWNESPSPTPTRPCGATATPYCSDHCEPCPTIRANCYADSCGECHENPTCGDGEACASMGFGGCCACATFTPTGPTPVFTPTPSSPTPGASCDGDCNDDGAVSVDELVAAVRVALGESALGNCATFDRDRDGMVSINELVAMVRNALLGCSDIGLAGVDGVYDVDVSGIPAGAPLAVVAVRGRNLRIDADLGIGESLGFDARQAEVGFDLDGGGITEGDIAYGVEGHGTLVRDSNGIHFLALLNYVNAPQSGGFALQLERPPTGTPSTYSGTYRLQLQHSPRVEPGFSSSIALTIAVDESGMATCDATRDVRDDDAVVAELAATECKLSPLGRLSYRTPYDKGNAFDEPLHLSGVLVGESGNGSGFFAVGQIPFNSDSGIWHSTAVP